MKIRFFRILNFTKLSSFIKRHIKKIIISCFLTFFGLMITIFISNLIIVLSTEKQIVSLENCKTIDKVDCIFVLGAGVWGDRPSPILEDRLKTAIKLYESGVANKIIMSGDHGRVKYDEVNLMKDYAVNKGIPSENIFMDHAGFSTYDSIYRASKIFNVNSMVIVTQEFHLARALYTSNMFKIKAYGVSADLRKYTNEDYLETRELIARCSYFFKTILKPKPKYLGNIIPITGDGNVTNDK